MPQTAHMTDPNAPDADAPAMPAAPAAPVAIYAVTGASGYVGSHVTRVLLERGFTVRACVRDPDNALKTAHLTAIAEGLPGDLSFHRGNLLEPGSYDAAFQGATCVIHTAAAVVLTAKDPQTDIVDPSMKGTQAVLDSAKAAGTVTRFVQTSSIAAVAQSPQKGRVYSEDDWNDTATVKTDPYGFAKVSAERLAAEFGAAHGLNPVTINPAFVIGPVYTKAHTKASPSVVRDIARATFPANPQLHFGLVDVRDVAIAHVEAALRTTLTGRYIICADSWWMQEMAKVAKELYPERTIRTGKLPNLLLRVVALFDSRLSGQMLKNLLGRESLYDNQRSKDALGIEYRPVRESIKDCIDSMLEGGFIK